MLKRLGVCGSGPGRVWPEINGREQKMLEALDVRA